MSFIEEFYFGNIDPQLRNVKENASFQRDMESLNKRENIDRTAYRRRKRAFY